MALESPQANLYLAILTRLLAMVPALKYIEQDLGQLDAYEIRPAVSWPCCLIDIEETTFSDAGGKLTQIGEGIISIRNGLIKYSDSGNLTNLAIREKALQYFEMEQQIYTALHGWTPPGFSRIMRRSSGTEKRTDDIRVRASRFTYTYTDTSAIPATQSVPRPGATIGI
jgi:hypothetical protein